jgi:hypothetical protein
MKKSQDCLIDFIDDQKNHMEQTMRIMDALLHDLEDFFHGFNRRPGADINRPGKQWYKQDARSL